MYFVAFFVDLKKSFIVPKQWIKDVKLHKAKFYNNGLNGVQTFSCFYSNETHAFEEDGLPNPSYQPNFDSLPQSTSLNGQGMFRVKLRKCFGKLFTKSFEQVQIKNTIE